MATDFIQSAEESEEEGIRPQDQKKIANISSLFTCIIHTNNWKSIRPRT